MTMEAPWHYCASPGRSSPQKAVTSEDNCAECCGAHSFEVAGSFAFFVVYCKWSWSIYFVTPKLRCVCVCFSLVPDMKAWTLWNLLVCGTSSNPLAWFLATGVIWWGCLIAPFWVTTVKSLNLTRVGKNILRAKHSSFNFYEGKYICFLHNLGLFAFSCWL